MSIRLVRTFKDELRYARAGRLAVRSFGIHTHAWCVDVRAGPKGSASVIENW